MTDEQYHGILNVLINLGQAIDRIEAAMLKREDVHPSNMSVRPMTEHDKLFADWEAAQAGGAATQEEPDMDAMVASPLLKAGEQREGGE